MTTPTSAPSSNIYVRPGWATPAWTYANLSLPAAAGTAAVTAVAFDASSGLDQQFSRGDLQYSVDNGKTWIDYAVPVDSPGTYIGTAGTVWRFLDRIGSETDKPDTFNVHYKLADNSIVTLEDTVYMDTQPVGVAAARDIVFTTAHSGDTVDTLLPIDSGAQTGGRWVIDSQSQGGLFAIVYDAAVDTAARLVVANAGALPAEGGAAAVTVHYYDRYQIDSNGNPVAGTGAARTLTYSVENGAGAGLDGFASETTIGSASASAAWHGQPALAPLSGGGFVAVWQAADTVAGGAGAGLWAQLRDAGGAALGAAFALTPDGDARSEGEPAVSALAGGRFVVAYTVDGAIAYRVVGANGAAGAEHVLDAGAGASAAAMPALATLADGSFVVGWRSGAAVHVQGVGADGVAAGAEQVYGALGSAYSPALGALTGGGYVVAWGEINDGNVYAATSAAPASVFIASGDGYAASIASAAPLPHVAALAGGGFVVAWDSYINDPRGFSISDIFFERFDGSGHALGAIGQANVASGGGRFDAAVTALLGGGFLVAWQGSDDDGNGIYGRRFDAGGSALDSVEFAINQLRSGDQTAPDVVALAGGGFAGAWVETGAGGAVTVEARVLPGDAGAHNAVVAHAGSPAVGDGAAAGAPAPNAAESSDAVLNSGAAAAPLAGGAGSNNAPAQHAAAGTPVAAGGIASGSPVAAHPAAAAAPIASAAQPVNTIAFGGDGQVRAALAGDSKVVGSAGLDTLVYASARAGAHIVGQSGGAVAVTDAGGNHALLTNVERLHFSDGMVALDVDGTAGQAYRLYQAAFDRTPDQGGLGYWIAALDAGTRLAQAASGFVASAEFTSLYGAHAGDGQFVQALYQNVLHRTAEGAGYAFWMATLHTTERADILVQFSDSAENQAQVIGSIQNGIDYLHWG